MGFELDQFVDPEHISPELICPICCGVLERPVQTVTDHLFCEDELLEWMERSDMCPVTNTKLNPSEIKKPSRIISNILGGLQIKCSNRSEGCTWSGKYDTLENHMRVCQYRPREQLRELLEKKTSELESIQRRYSELKGRCKALEDDNLSLTATNESLKRQLKVYDAFIRSHHGDEEGSSELGTSTSLKTTGQGSVRSDRESDLQVINRLRLLEEKIGRS